MPACCSSTKLFLGIGIIAAICLAGGLAFNNRSATGQESENEKGTDAVVNTDESGVATFGGGCFWCVEAVFKELKGVSAVSSGYMGGHVENPTYAQVCDKMTGHAEVVRIEYDPEQVSFAKLLEVFWATHDPTTMNRQGNDSGPQYRSAVFYHNDEQRATAEEIKSKLDESGAFNAPIVTEITAASKHWPAEGYHQDYFSLNPNQGYCRAIIVPKMAKFRKVFADDLKSGIKSK